MTRTEELLALAEAATSGPWGTNPADAFSSELEVTANNRYISVCEAAPYDALFIAVANPETVRQLVELVRQMANALEDPFTMNVAGEILRTNRELAIEAFNKWNQQ